MRAIIILGLLGTAGVVLWKRHEHKAAVKTTQTAEETNMVPSGVNEYDDTPAANKPGQILAAYESNPDSVSEPGFAPAFGPDENQ